MTGDEVRAAWAADTSKDRVAFAARHGMSTLSLGYYIGAATECRDCGRQLQRDGSLETSVSGPARNGRCVRCHRRALNPTARQRRTQVDRAVVVEEWAHLSATGATMSEAASRLGMTVQAFERAIMRARADERNRKP